MAKDYFQDILPPDEPRRHHHAQRQPHETHEHEEPETERGPSDEETKIPIHAAHESRGNERTIRNISVPQRARARHLENAPVAPRRGQGGARWLLWTIAGVCVIALGLLGFVAMRSTVVTVAPRTLALSFDATKTFTAYPTTTAANGTLAYSLRTADLEDSQVVAANGTVHAEEKASGTITVYNAYQTAPLKLIKNTRFQSPDGHIFRSPSDIVIPGKNGSTAGHVDVTVIADQTGEAYNVGAGKFTVPGLKSNAAMYASVYAQSAAPMSGGFSGDRPGVDNATLQSAVSEVRGRLEAKAHDTADQVTGDVVALPDLMQITYTDEPQTTEAGGGVRIHETAHVSIPVFPAGPFVQAVGNTDSTGASIVFVPGSDFSAQLVSSSSTPGTDPLAFTLKGKAQLVWGVDTTALAAALAGKPQASFEAIVSQFPGIDTAHARIEPFWKSTFPAAPSSIKVSVQQPKGL